jgi:hypothetical protein
VRRIRTHNPKVPILSRAHGLAEANKLISMGSTEVIQPEVEASATLIRHTSFIYRSLVGLDRTYCAQDQPTPFRSA